MRHLIALAAVAALAANATAALQFNEVQFDAPGTNPTKRFFEIRSTTGGVESLAGVTLIAIDGDGTQSGTIDFAQSFDGLSTGANGLFLFRDSATVVLNPAPAAETTVFGVDYAYNENTAVTYALVTGFTGVATAGAVAGTDIDADNNGVIDTALPFASVVDAFGVIDAADFGFGGQLGFVDFDENAAPYNDADIFGLVRDPQNDSLNTFRSVGTVADGFTVDLSPTLPVGYRLTPGNVNGVVPEPSTLSLVALAGLALSRRRR